jgi:hypothetical protein
MPVVDFVPDFSPLSKLGEIWEKAQQREAEKRAYANPNLSHEERARVIGAAGNTTGARDLLALGETIRQHNAAQAHQAAQFGLSKEQFAETQKQNVRSGDQFQQTRQDTEAERLRADARAESERLRKVASDEETARRNLEVERIRAEPEAARLARAAGLVPGTQEFKDFIIQQGKAQRGISPGEQKIITAAEESLPAIDQTIRNVEHAMKLNPNVHTGWGAELRGKLGDWTSDRLVPDVVSTPEQGAATRRWNQLMSGEAIKVMSETLKGASTDYELRKNLELAADLNNSPKVREDAMIEVLKYAKERREVRVKELEQIRRGDFFKPGGGTSTPKPAGGGLAANPAALDEAKAAIATGKITRTEAINRLVKAGINPSGL